MYNYDLILHSFAKRLTTLHIPAMISHHRGSTHLRSTYMTGVATFREISRNIRLFTYHERSDTSKPQERKRKNTIFER